MRRRGDGGPSRIRFYGITANYFRVISLLRVVGRPVEGGVVARGGLGGGHGVGVGRIAGGG